VSTTPPRPAKDATLPLTTAQRADLLGRYSRSLDDVVELEPLLAGNAQQPAACAIGRADAGTAPNGLRSWLIVGIDADQAGLGELFDARAEHAEHHRSPFAGVVSDAQVSAFTGRGGLVRIDLLVAMPVARHFSLLFDVDDDEQALYAAFDGAHLLIVPLGVFEHLNRRPFADTLRAGIPVFSTQRPDPALADALARGHEGTAAQLVDAWRQMHAA
jgi:hypothetical protein